jgi:hypothetical protein
MPGKVGSACALWCCWAGIAYIPGARSRLTLAVNPHGQYGRRRANGRETARVGIQAVRLPARGRAGLRLGTSCPRLAEEGHGSWFFSLELPRHVGGARRRIRRGGYASREEAERALSRLQVTGGRALTLADWLEIWLTTRTRVRDKTLRGCTAVYPCGFWRCGGAAGVYGGGAGPGSCPRGGLCIDAACRNVAASPGVSSACSSRMPESSPTLRTAVAGGLVFVDEGTDSRVTSLATVTVCASTRTSATRTGHTAP